jgi:ribosome modulation factor
MATAELHGQKINPFEQGYAAFLKGIGLKQNPFETEQNTSPHSKQRWIDGWNKAQREAWRKV